MKKVLLGSLAAAVLAITLAACGGGGGGATGTGLNNAKTVTGTVYSASGDPVPGVTVYIPGVPVTAQYVKATRTYNKAVAAADGTTCEDPPASQSPLASACSAADGTFNMDTSTITTNPTQFVMRLGSLTNVGNLNCPGTDVCNLSSSDTTFGSSATWPKIAVVTGNYDRIEDVLAKLADSNTSDELNGAYGRVDSTMGMFVYGSEFGTNLTIINGPLPVTPTENADQLTYQTWDKYLDGTIPIVSDGSPVFDVIFVNCGEDVYDAAMVANKTTLQNFVNAGGRLYVTDLSYDFIEQPFPQFMQYENDPADPNTPGALGVAQIGTDGVWLNAVVNDINMRNWLQGTGVSVNAHDANTPGNPDFDCSSPPYIQHQGALLDSGLIPLGDFLTGWAQMVGPHTGYSPTIWISSGSGVVFDGRDNRPLTVSMDSGSNGGRLFYSSYHTAHSCPTPTFWPQERVMQYLIFGSF